MATHRGNTTDALGFRCAASLTPGADAAQALLKDDIKLNVLPQDVDFNVEGAVVARNWKSSEGTAKKVKQFSGGKRVEGSIEGMDTVGQGRVCRKPAGQATTGREQHVADFRNLGRAQSRTERKAADTFECIGDAVGLPGELHS